MLVLLFAAGWVAIGVVAAMVMRRRGHDPFGWVILFVILGPLAVPLAGVRRGSVARRLPKGAPVPLLVGPRVR